MPELFTRPTTVLLTGATSGIGTQMLSQLIASGHKVIAVSRKASALSAESGVTGYDCDLADPQAVEAMASAVLVKHPDIRIIINNAGLQLPMRLDDPALATNMLVDEIAINVLAPTIIARAFMPQFMALSEPSAIVNISSGLAFFPKTTTGLYCATKAAIHSLSQSMRYQSEGTQMRVIEAILPLVDTPMTKGRGTGKLPADTAARAIIAGIRKGHDEVYIGKAQLLRILGRLAPFIPRRILKAS